MTDISSIRELIKRAILGIPKGMKNAIPIAFRVNILIINESIISKELKTKNRLK